jgi:glyoxylase-like metal-dependent hydrolase (beta-lactamase superfamily II)
LQIVPGVYGVAQQNRMYTFAYLVDQPDGLILIDTLYDDDGQRILDAIAELGRRPTDITQIVLTHAHRAHLGGLATLKALSGAPVYSHEWESGIVAGSRRGDTVSWLPKGLLSTYPYQILHNLGLAKFPPCPVDEFITEGDRVGPFTVMHTPGHSTGHLSFHWPESGLLICGDTVVSHPKFVPGWPGFTLDARQQAASVRRMANLEPRILAFGHGPPIVEDSAKKLWSLVDKV